MAPALVERWLTDGYRAAEPGLSQVLVDMLRRTSDAGYSRNCAALRDADYRDRVAAIRARTLVISSTHDLAATPAQGRELAPPSPARATSSWTRHTSPTGNGPRNSTAPCSASCWPSESRRTPHATLETPARGLELGRLRPRRPTRPPQPHHRRTGAQGAREIRAGKTFCLSLPLDLPGGNVLNPRRHPPQLSPTRLRDTPYLNFPLRNVNPDALDVLSDDQVLLSMQYSTQWDALAHVGALFDADGDGVPELRYYNGCRRRGRDRPADGSHAGCGCDSGGPSAALKLGIEHLAQKGMQGRGVLVDLERHYGAGRTLIGHAELMRVIEADGIEIEPGDMLVLRTGYAEAVVAMNGQPDADTLHSYGAALDGTDEALLQWITDSGIAAICADNYAVEAYPRASAAARVPCCRCTTTACSSWACRWPSCGT